MSIIKIPCIFMVTAGVHESFTPPNISTKDEKLPLNGTLEWAMMLMRKYMWSIKGVYWAVGFAEAATILADSWQSAPGSSHILSKLVIIGNANNIRLTSLSTTGVVLVTLGTLLRMRCYRVMKRSFTFDISIRKDHKLVTTGPYGIVRHPSYAGMLMVYVGMACWFGSRGSWLRESGVLETWGGKAFFGMFGTMMSSVMVGLLRRMSTEDEVLRKEFGNTWIEYANVVAYSLIPWVY